jgi:hypothetical protein
VSYALRQDDLDFLDRAPLRQSRTAVVDMPVDQVFGELSGHPEGWPRWLLGVRDCRYEGDGPYGVGSVRRISLRGGIVAMEEILAWDKDRRFAYRVNTVNAPGVRTFMEEWTVEPTTEGQTQMQWVIGADGTKPLQLLLQLGCPALDRVFKQGARRMATS